MEEASISNSNFPQSKLLLFETHRSADWFVNYLAQVPPVSQPQSCSQRKMDAYGLLSRNVSRWLAVATNKVTERLRVTAPPEFTSPLISLVSPRTSTTAAVQGQRHFDSPLNLRVKIATGGSSARFASMWQRIVGGSTSIEIDNVPTERDQFLRASFRQCPFPMSSVGTCVVGGAPGVSGCIAAGPISLTFAAYISRFA